MGCELNSTCHCLVQKRRKGTTSQDIKCVVFAMAAIGNELQKSYNIFCRLTEEIVVVISHANGDRPPGYGHQISLSARK